MENQFRENIEITGKTKSSKNKKSESGLFSVKAELNKRLRHFFYPKKGTFKSKNLRYLFMY